MQRLIIQGGSRLNGEITVQGAKNAALPLLAGCVLINGEIRLHNCPALSDVFAACRILSVLGARCSREDGCVTVDARGAVKTFVPDELMREMRSSIVFLGAVLGRTGECRLSFPGGCELGPRPIDMHLCALRKMGVRINEEYGVLSCTCPRGLRGARIDLSFRPLRRLSLHRSSSETPQDRISQALLPHCISPCRPLPEQPQA